MCVWDCLCGQVSMCMQTKAQQIQAVPWACSVIHQEQPGDGPAGLPSVPMPTYFFIFFSS